ncbi:hypothetical protein BT93_E2235 [Corymbia citriodora subsp. variegata]|nr:hypothetical protein BT93_E2235 [Corymbia citriodora subsp. variegata]
MSIIILDDLERLLEYTAIGHRYSELIYSTLLDLLKRCPPEGKRLLVIGTTSKLSFLDSVGVSGAFSVTRHVPTLKTDEVKEVLERLNVFSEDDVHEAAKALNDMPLKKIYMLLEMARVRHVGAGREKIDMAGFHDCLRGIRR